MESKLKGPTLIESFKIMGPLFYVPPILILAGGLFCLIGFWGNVQESSEINKWFGIASIPIVPVWILSYLKEFVDKQKNIWILYLPYCDKYLGYKRILSFIIIYSTLFYLIYTLLIIKFKLWETMQVTQLVLPFFSISYLAALSFLLIVLIKNYELCYAIIGSYSAFLYLTRGGMSKGVYPFQWMFPNSIFNDGTVLILLICCTILFFWIGQLLFSNRTYLGR